MRHYRIVRPEHAKYRQAVLHLAEDGRLTRAARDRGIGVSE